MFFLFFFINYLTLDLTHYYLFLIFQDYNAKLSDFGLAKDGLEGDGTHVSLGVTYRDIKYNHIIFDSVSTTNPSSNNPLLNLMFYFLSII